MIRIPPALDGSFPTPLQVGSSPELVLVAIVGQVLTLALAIWITYRIWRGYRQAREPALYWLAVGIVLLAAAPTAVRFLIPTVTEAPFLVTTIVATSSEVVGLGAILYAVYGNP